MDTRTTFMIVHFVERQLEGWTYERAHWPLYITLVPWFSVQDDEAVVRSLDRVAAEIAPLRVKVGGEAMFGPNEDVPVNVIRNQAPVKALHEILTITLEEADMSFHEDNYIHGQYAAHITRHTRDNRHANNGEELIMDNFHLVRQLDATTCQVEQEFVLTTKG